MNGRLRVMAALLLTLAVLSGAIPAGAAALPPLVAVDTVRLGTGHADGSNIDISYPRTNLTMLNDVLDELFNQHFGELLEEQARDRSFGYSIDYQGTEYSSRLAVVYGFGACWGGGAQPYQFLGSVIIWDKEKNEQVAIEEIFEDPDCLGNLEEVSVITDGAGPGAAEATESVSPAGVEFAGIIIPTADGFLVCSDYSGPHGYQCRPAVPGSIESACPVKPEYR